MLTDKAFMRTSIIALSIGASLVAVSPAEASVGRYGYDVAVEITQAVEDNGKCGDNMDWSVNSEGILTITGTGKMYSFVQGRAPWYLDGNQSAIVKADISNGVESISESAFANLLLPGQ